jgi:hypothetical protein
MDLESSTMDAICGIAFGANWENLKSLKDQLETYQPKVSKLGEILYPVTRPDLLESTLRSKQWPAVLPHLADNGKFHDPTTSRSSICSRPV